MSLIIDNASLLGYKYETKFFGQYRFGYIQNYTVEGIIIPSNTNTFLKNTKDNLSYINIYSSGLKQDQEIIVNGKNFGTGRIVSLKNANDFNPAVATKYNLSFEIYNPGANDLFGLSIANQIPESYLIEDFSENFDFNIGSDAFRNSSHDISVKYRDLSAGSVDPNSPSGVINKSKVLANGIFNLGINFDFLNTVFNDLKTTTIKKYYKENYDLINHKCSFNQTFKLSKDTGIAFGDHTYKNTFTLNQDGIIEVSEQGKMQGYGEPQETAYSNAVLALPSIISGSMNRCNQVFLDYKDSNSLNSDLYESLFTGNYISLNKNHNRYEGYIEYNVSYTNDKKYITSGYKHEYQNNYSKDNLDVVNLERDGTFKRIRNDKNINFNETGQLIQKLNNSLNTAPDELKSFYSSLSGVTGSLYQLNKSINYPVYGNEMNYNSKYSDDRSFNVDLNLSGYFNKTELTIDDTPPSHIYNEYIIPNVKTLFSAGNQTLLGKRSITLNGILTKKTTNANFGTSLISENFISKIKFYIASKLINNLNQNLNQIRELFITNCSYNVDSDFNFSITLEISYSSYVPAFDTNELFLNTGVLL